MRFTVRHTTHYRYTSAVALDPHTFRLCPRGNGSQRVTHFELVIDPLPTMVSETLDAENNGVHQAWFEGATSDLIATTRFEVETLRANPFDFLFSDLAMATLPAIYPDLVRATLAPYCVPQGKDRSVFSFARAAAQDVEWQTLPFLTALNRKLHDYCEHTTREEGEPQSPAETLSTRSGACRDVAVAFIEACRCLGLAARFVSGYELTASKGNKAYMHAWAEVFLPGGGWRGYDPSRGHAAGETHIAVASGLTPPLAAPVSGTFRGSGVEAKMDFDIQVTEHTPAAA